MIKPTIAEQFESLWTRVHKGKPVSQNQKEECRKFFFSGFNTLLLNQLHYVASIPDAEGIKWMEEREKEIKHYFATELHGRPVGDS